MKKWMIMINTACMNKSFKLFACLQYTDYLHFNTVYLFGSLLAPQLLM